MPGLKVILDSATNKNTSGAVYLEVVGGNFSGGGGGLPQVEVDPYFRSKESSLATKQDLLQFDTKTSTDTKIDTALGDYYKKEEVDNKIASIEVPTGFDPVELPDEDPPVGEGTPGVIYITPLGDAYLWSQSQNKYIEWDNTVDLSAYAKTSDLANYPTTIQVTNAINTSISSLSEEYAVKQTEVILDNHRYTDRYRWQDTYNEQLKSIVRDAHSEGLTIDGTFTAISYPYTVTAEYGGILESTYINPDENTYYEVKVNGQSIYSSEGLSQGVTVIKYSMLNKGDIVTSENNTNPVLFVPFKPDTESPFYQVVLQVNSNQDNIGKLQNNFLDFKASIDNKVLDPDPLNIENILNTTYTVTNSLGGRLNGKGYVLLGLLGVKLVATGVVDVTYTNGITVEEYNNTALVGAGEANPFVLDVDSGTVIVSTGMDSLTFTPYIPK